jgi:hypothetical protein
VVSQASYTVPADTPDGHYHFRPDEYGNALGILLEVSDVNNKRFLIKVRQPENYPIHCNGYSINLSDLGVAVNGLDSWYDTSGNDIEPGYGNCWVCGTSIAYVCNYYNIINSCESSSSNVTSQMEDGGLGDDNAGWVHIVDWGISCGRPVAGADILLTSTWYYIMEGESCSGDFREDKILKLQPGVPPPLPKAW